MQQLNYTLKITLSKTIEPITIAGFNTDESSESIICKHLYNVCKQTNGSFIHTQKLLNNAIASWQQSFSLQALQMLKSVAGIEAEKINCIYLYKNLNNHVSLVNKICL